MPNQFDFQLVPIMIPKEVYDILLPIAKDHQRSVAEEIATALATHIEKFSETGPGEKN